MSNSLFVEVVKAKSDLVEIGENLFFIHFLFLLDNIKQISLSAAFQDYIEIVVVFKGLNDFENVPVI